MSIICLCRRGFEKEVAAEITDKALNLMITGFVKAQADTGFVEYVSPTIDDDKKLILSTPFAECVFIRQWFLCVKTVKNLPKDDRVTPLMASMEGLPAISQIEPVVFDTNEGKSLVALTKGVATVMRQKLNKQKKLKAKNEWIGQCVFFDGDTACIGAYPAHNASPWKEGIIRLRSPKNAPSRATLKLEEAWHQFIPKDQWDTRIAPSMRAVDLGAAPGGWTWQLVNRSMFVDAVDNGPMHIDLMESGQVSHHTDDAYKYEPARKVHWLVSDIADKPARVAQLIARWGANHWFDEAIFNLKLPMKKRYNELLFCQSIIAEALTQADIKFTMHFKQLYHDREEVTGHIVLRS